MQPDTSIKGLILCVDDTPGNLRVLLESLSSVGHEVLVATDGASAIETARYAKPELILMDVMMPGISGYEACAQLKAQPETAHVPVIFMTALQDTDDKVKAFDSGAVDYVTKPFAEAELLARVQTHLTLARLRSETIRRNAQLEELNTIKNEFMGMAAHDVRNPLTTIMASADLVSTMLTSDPSGRIRKFVGHISTAASRINAIITNLLDVNAIDSGNRSLDLTHVNLGEIVDRLVQQHAIRASAKDIKINYTPVRSGVDARVDAGAAEQVIENILSNAIKYSQPGNPVRVSLRLVGDHIRVEIADNGPGLSTEDQAKMFGKFCRLAPKPTAGEPSTGLGLWIVKRLTESMHGTIRCESELGKGSTFIVEWPKSIAVANAA